MLRDLFSGSNSQWCVRCEWMLHRGVRGESLPWAAPPLHPYRLHCTRYPYTYRLYCTVLLPLYLYICRVLGALYLLPLYRGCTVLDTTLILIHTGCTVLATLILIYIQGILRVPYTYTYRANSTINSHTKLILLICTFRLHYPYTYTYTQGALYWLPL